MFILESLTSYWHVGLYLAGRKRLQLSTHDDGGKRHLTATLDRHFAICHSTAGSHLLSIIEHSVCAFDEDTRFPITEDWTTFFDHIAGMQRQTL